MCDYSLENVKSVPAQIGDKLVVRQFGSGTAGFGYADEITKHTGAVAVCLRPGTEVAFEQPISKPDGGFFTSKAKYGKVAVFTQVDTDQTYTHHDALETPDGQVVKLAHLKVGQYATVLQLPVEFTPVEPKSEMSDELAEAIVNYVLELR